MEFVNEDKNLPNEYEQIRSIHNKNKNNVVIFYYKTSRGVNLTQLKRPLNMEHYMDTIDKELLAVSLPTYTSLTLLFEKDKYIVVGKQLVNSFFPHKSILYILSPYERRVTKGYNIFSVAPIQIESFSYANDTTLTFIIATCIVIIALCVTFNLI